MERKWLVRTAKTNPKSQLGPIETTEQYEGRKCRRPARHSDTMYGSASAADTTPGSRVYVKGHGPALVVDSPPVATKGAKHPALGSSSAGGAGGGGDYIKVRLLSLSDVGASLEQLPEGPLADVGLDQLLPDGAGPDGASRFQHFQTPAKHQSRQTAAVSAVFTLVSTILGGGVLSLPFALQQCGIVFGGIVLVFSAVISGYSADLLLGISRTVGKDSYENLGTFGA